MSKPLPTDQTLAKLLGGLLGKTVEVKSAPPYDPKPDGRYATAFYINDEGVNTAVCICDLPLTCAMGACLTMIPVGMVKESIKAGEIPEMMFDNAKEIFNISSSIFNEKGSPHLRLGKTFLIPPAPPQEIAELLNHTADRVDFQVTVPVYGSGLISFRFF